MPAHPCPHHCPSGGGGVSAAAVAVVVLAVFIAAARRAIIHAADVLLDVVLIAAAVTIGLAVLTASAYAAYQVHRYRSNRRRAVSVTVLAPAARSQAIPAPRVRAIEAPRQQPGNITATRAAGRVGSQRFPAGDGT